MVLLLFALAIPGALVLFGIVATGQLGRRAIVADPNDTRAVWQLVRGPAGPTLVAAALALISLPFVAGSLDAVSTTSRMTADDVAYLPLGDPARWTSALGAVLVSALIAGTIGGLVVRRSTILGAWVALGLAWWFSVDALQTVPYLLHQHVGFTFYCLDSCGPAWSSDSPPAIDGLLWVVQVWMWPFSILFAPGPFLCLLVGVIAWTAILRRAGTAR